MPGHQFSGPFPVGAVEFSSVFAERFSLVPIAKATGMPLGVLSKMEFAMNRVLVHQEYAKMNREFKGLEPRDLLFQLFKQRPHVRKARGVEYSRATYRLRATSVRGYVDIDSEVVYAQRLSLGLDKKIVVNIVIRFFSGREMIAVTHKFEIDHSLRHTFNRQARPIARMPRLNRGIHRLTPR